MPERKNQSRNGLIHVLERHADGATIEALDDVLFQVNSGVQMLHETGELTIKIKMKPALMAGKPGVEIDIDHKAKIPEPAHPTTTMYYGERTGFTRDDPDQVSFRFKDLRPEDPGDAEVGDE